MKKKKYKKKISALILIFALLFTMVPTSIFANSESSIDAEGSIANIELYKMKPGDSSYIDFKFDPNQREYVIYKPVEDKPIGDTLKMDVAFSDIFIDTNDLFYEVTSISDNASMRKGKVESGGKATNINLVAFLRKNAKPGKAAELHVKVGKKDKYDKFIESETVTYKFIFKRKLALKDIVIKDGDKVLTVEPKIDNKSYNYTIKAPYVSDTVTIEPKLVVPAGVNLEVTYRINAKEWNLQEPVSLKTSETGKKYFELEVQYKDTSNTNVKSSNYLFTVDNSDYYPSVGLECEKEYVTPKDEVINLKVDAKGLNSDKYRYQWYSSNGDYTDDIKSHIINGATSAEFKAPTNVAGTKFYHCRVTSNVDGVTFETKSETIKVTTEQTYANLPVILKQPKNTEAVQFETAKEFYVYAITEETNAVLTYQWYEKIDGRDDILIKDATESKFVAPSDKLGKHKYYCRVTAKFLNTDIVSHIDTEVVTLTVKKLLGLDSIVGEGTDQNPYQIKNINDLECIRNVVNKGYGLEGRFIKLMADITIPAGWEPIGCLIDPTLIDQATGELDTGFGTNVYPLMATFDGNNKTITIESGGKAPFHFLRKATIKNLNIYGKDIKGPALADGSFIDYGEDGIYETGAPWTLLAENITLKSGSRCDDAGMVDVGGSGANTVAIMNSVVEKNVKVKNGSFANGFDGVIINCKSSADITGNHCGGIVSHKSQTMGAFLISNCVFDGTINSSGCAGGIVAHGYGAGGEPDKSAPNTPAVSIKNCYVYSDIVGSGKVGGILGAEPSLECCWDNGQGTISNNYFYGTLKETSGSGYVGGIVGYMRSFNKHQGFDNNYYLDSCGAGNGIGKIETLITKDHPKYGSEYGIDYKFDENAVCTRTSAKEFADGSITTKLNLGKFSSKNWIQSDKMPTLSEKPIVYKLEISDYKTEYNVGDIFDNNMKITGTYTDGRVVDIPLDEVDIIGFSTSKAADLKVKVKYQSAEASYYIKVRHQNPAEVNVNIVILGDSKHGEPTDATGTHTLKDNNLEKWYSGSFKLTENDTVWDVLKRVGADTQGKIKFSNPSGNYVDYVIYNGLKLGEFDNGKNSGWMYTLNSKHSQLGVSEQFLDDGDEIVFHYTDDYTKEDGSEDWGPGGEEKPPVDPDKPEPPVDPDKPKPPVIDPDPEQGGGDEKPPVVDPDTGNKPEDKPSDKPADKPAAKPDTDKKPASPQTGDENEMLLLGIALLASAGAFTGLARKKKTIK